MKKRTLKRVLILGISLLTLAFLFTSCEVAKQIADLAGGDSGQDPEAVIVGGDVIIKPGEMVTLDGTQSSDPDDATLTFIWELKSVGFDSELQVGQFGTGALIVFLEPDVEGIYIVWLTVRSINGSHTAKVQITAKETNQPPAAVATADYTTIPLGDSVNFYSTGSDDPDGIIESYSWQLDYVPAGSSLTAGEFSTEINASLKPDVEGTYEVLLTVTDNEGGTGDSSAVSITVQSPPVAVIMADGELVNNVFVNKGVSVALDGSGSYDPGGGSISSYSWSLIGGIPDGSTWRLGEFDATDSKTFTPDVVGTYSIQLTVTDIGGATGSAEISITAENQPPVADAGGNQSVQLDDIVNLNGSGTDSDGVISSYSWSLIGDIPSGSILTAGEFATLASATFTPDVVGTYYIEFTVTDDDGATDVDQITVTVVAAGANLPPTADAGPDQTVDVDVVVNFSGSGSGTDGAIVSYEWNFGDGSPVEEGPDLTSPSHTYSAAGVYEVELTVKDEYGAMGSDTAVVTVVAPNQAPVANAGPDKTGYVGDSVSFSGAGSSDSDGKIVSYSWKFGDGSSGSGVTTSHVYKNSGTFDVTLTVTDDDGATAEDTARVTVNEKADVLLLYAIGYSKVVYTPLLNAVNGMPFVKSLTSYNGAMVRIPDVDYQAKFDLVIVASYDSWYGGAGDKLGDYLAAYVEEAKGKVLLLGKTFWGGEGGYALGGKIMDPSLAPILLTKTIDFNGKITGYAKPFSGEAFSTYSWGNAQEPGEAGVPICYINDEYIGGAYHQKLPIMALNVMPFTDGGKINYPEPPEVFDKLLELVLLYMTNPALMPR